MSRATRLGLDDLDDQQSERRTCTVKAGTGFLIGGLEPSYSETTLLGDGGGSSDGSMEQGQQALSDME